MTRKQLKEAKLWIMDCFPDEEDDLQELSTTEIERGIARHYEGGIEQFIKDGA